jgi:acyl dehydratase
MSQLYFEDLSIGTTRELGTYEITREEIFEFAEQYDPQPFHLDETAAEESIFGELIASGWQTASIYIRLLTEGFIEDTSHLAGKRVSDLRWLQPVRPGDTLSGTVEILDKSASDSHPERGYVDYRVVGSNQNDETILRMDLHGVFGRRAGTESNRF